MENKQDKNPEIFRPEGEGKMGTNRSTNVEAIAQLVVKKALEEKEEREASAQKSSRLKLKKAEYTPPEILLPKDNSEKTKKKYLGFGKYERKLKQARCIKSLLGGLALSFLVGGILLLLMKINEWQINPVIILSSMVGAFLIAFLPIFLTHRINDKKVAKAIDEKFGLKERASTAIEYLDDDSDMNVLLRNDVRSIVEGIDARAVKAFKLITIYICAFVLGLTMLIVGVAYPTKDDNAGSDTSEEENNTIFVLTEEQKDRLNEIKASVEASDMEETAKQEVVEEIQSLTLVLDTVQMLKSDAIDLIKLTTEKIDKITDETGSQSELYTALKNQDSAYTREFARLLTKYDWEKHLIKRADIQELFRHKDFGSDVADLDQIELDTIIALNNASTQMKKALENSGVDASDPLYDLLYRFTYESDPTNKETKGEGLYGTQEIANEMEYLSYRWAQNRLDDLFSILGEDIYRELDAQNVNYSVGFDASNDIRSLFGLPKVNREDNSKEEDEETEKDKEPPEGADGGLGDGNVFGSDDAIYDKEELNHIAYGEVIDRYYIIMGNAEYTEEQKAKIQKYFETLFRGLEEKDEE
ncbi:MAG: YrzE family protein [Clostridia bacterium]|nr:YrzE family protein [Clostridia bacterium]